MSEHDGDDGGQGERNGSRNGQDGAIVLTVDHRFKRANDEEKVISESEEVVQVQKFETTPAVVRRGYGMTLNLGGYESARLDVAVEVPCYVEDIHLADRWAENFVKKRVKAEVENVRGKRPSKPNNPI